MHRKSRQAAAFLAALAVVACAAGPADQARSDREEAQPVFRLDRSDPSFTQVLPVVAGDPEIKGIRVPIQYVSNPHGASVRVSVWLRGGGPGRGVVQLGEHHLFPADRPVTFVVPVPSGFGTSWPKPSGSVDLHIRLEAVDGASLEGVELEVGPAVWER